MESCRWETACFCLLSDHELMQRTIPELPPAGLTDPVIEAYKKDVDRTLLRAHLRLTPDERVIKFAEFLRQQTAIRGAFRETQDGSGVEAVNDKSA